MSPPSALIAVSSAASTRRVAVPGVYRVSVAATCPLIQQSARACPAMVTPVNWNSGWGRLVYELGLMRPREAPLANSSTCWQLPATWMVVLDEPGIHRLRIDTYGPYSAGSRCEANAAASSFGIRKMSETPW